eukprot:NODE_789_length_3873_cov_0.228405.p8 type:complete len:109 gc:universal NODE_789_length_3873_cov_0.228405:2309-1983(-)
MPISSLKTVPFVNTAKSSKMAFRLSPNPGALTAATLTCPLNLFKIHAASASPSTSSAIINNGRRLLAAISKAGKISTKAEIFLSVSKMNGFSYSTLADLASVTKYGEI